jgi:hypothetical protein
MLSLWSAPAIFAMLLIILLYVYFTSGMSTFAHQRNFRLFIKLFLVFTGFVFHPTVLPAPLIHDQSPFIPNPDINLTQLLLSPALPFHVIVGSHDIGKSTAIEFAASEVSKSRTVLFLRSPPTDFEFCKLFFRMPSWLTFFNLLEYVPHFQIQY